MLLAVGLSGCIRNSTTNSDGNNIFNQENPVSKGDVVLTVEDVLITNELEVFDYRENEIKIKVSNKKKF